MMPCDVMVRGLLCAAGSSASGGGWMVSRYDKHGYSQSKHSHTAIAWHAERGEREEVPPAQSTVLSSGTRRHRYHRQSLLSELALTLGSWCILSRIRLPSMRSCPKAKPREFPWWLVRSATLRCLSGITMDCYRRITASNHTVLHSLILSKSLRTRCVREISTVTNEGVM